MQALDVTIQRAPRGYILNYPNLKYSERSRPTILQNIRMSRYIFSTKPAIKRHIYWELWTNGGVAQSNGYNKIKYKYIFFRF